MSLDNLKRIKREAGWGDVMSVDPQTMLALLAVVEAAQEALEALASSYDAVDWPADGTSRQEIAAAALRSALAGLAALSLSVDAPPPDAREKNITPKEKP